MRPLNKDDTLLWRVWLKMKTRPWANALLLELLGVWLNSRLVVGGWEGFGPFVQGRLRSAGGNQAGFRAFTSGPIGGQEVVATDLLARRRRAMAEQPITELPDDLQVYRV